MMKWGRKKPSLPSPSHYSSSSSIFPSSWFSSTKQKMKDEPSKVDRETPTSWKSGRFYGGGDNSDWKLSFEENYEVEKSNLKSVWYDSENEDENQEFGFPSCRKDDVAKREELLKFNQMVSNIRKLKESSASGRENGESNRNSGKERKLKKKNREESGEKKVDFQEKVDKVEEAYLALQEKDVFELKPVKLARASRRGNHRKGAYLSNWDFETIEEAYMLEALKLDKKRVDSEWEKSKEMKYMDLMEKSENQRKSVYITTEEKRKTKNNTSRIRAYSPRTAYKIECKIKAIENMKRAKKKEQRMREEPAQYKTVFDSFAVVKNSCDPQSDFKNSMIEMIMANKITKSEELEELLACYLTLNTDIYHETIIKVFRQVWFELIRDHLTSAIEN